MEKEEEMEEEEKENLTNFENEFISKGEFKAIKKEIKEKKKRIQEQIRRASTDIPYELRIGNNQVSFVNQFSLHILCLFLFLIKIRH